MRTLALRWISVTVTGTVAAALVLISSLPLEIAIPVRHLEMAWTIARALIEF